ncbi:hypothetical protein QYE76_036688 [Lolium multiflorum]|uniref:Uncharacterized protein n=1 Tax=Lolium multiflorum TaxID=4521 RepID=A0AAD8R2Y4_LOLMU|nr:hypothetical protein QYE76_036688 [Lolium multiflorum]
MSRSAPTWDSASATAAAAPQCWNEELGELAVALHISPRAAFAITVGIVVVCVFCVLFFCCGVFRGIGRRCAGMRARRRVHPADDVDL